MSRGYGATAARLTPDQKVGSSNLSTLILQKCEAGFVFALLISSAPTYLSVLGWTLSAASPDKTRTHAESPRRQGRQVPHSASRHRKQLHDKKCSPGESGPTCARPRARCSSMTQVRRRRGQDAGSSLLRDRQHTPRPPPPSAKTQIGKRPPCGTKGQFAGRWAQEGCSGN